MVHEEERSKADDQRRRASTSMYPQELGSIPEETVRIARAACPKGTLAMRLDWKYCLGLELTDKGFDFSLLSEFRQRLSEQGSGHLLLDRLLDLCKERGWLKAGGKQRTDATHVLARYVRLPTWNAWEKRCVPRDLQAIFARLSIPFINRVFSWGSRAQ